jgi:hypothetical protein
MGHINLQKQINKKMGHVSSTNSPLSSEKNR